MKKRIYSGLKSGRGNMLLIGAVLIYFSTYVVSSCQHDNEVPTVSIIDNVSATPASVTQGQKVTLSVSASSDGQVSYLWNAAKGEFSDPQNDTTEWTAPDESGTYHITVVASDSRGSFVATVDVGVDVYSASVSPSYLGYTNCVTCHESITDQWHKTGHGEAMTTLKNIFQDQNTRCLTCHTVGHDPAIDNGGYDEVPVSRLADVQCENCHGPASLHNGIVSGISISYDAETCGTCHQDEHHPYLEEWQESEHATSLTSAGGLVANNNNCVKCHVSEAFVKFVKTGITPTASSLTTKNPINCQSCHDPHSNSNDHQLRTATVDLVCGECHTAGSIDDVEDPGEPHHPQWNMLHGTDGLEYAGVEYENSPHVNVVEGKCGHCHVSMVPFGGEGSPAKTGHTFNPELRSCTTCHPNATGFDVNGVQTEIAGLIEDLHDRLEMASSADSVTVAFKQALYNLEFVDADGSTGVHNTRYARGLLESSLEDFNP